MPKPRDHAAGRSAITKNIAAIPSIMSTRVADVPRNLRTASNKPPNRIAKDIFAAGETSSAIAKTSPNRFRPLANGDRAVTAIRKLGKYIAVTQPKIQATKKHLGLDRFAAVISKTYQRSCRRLAPGSVGLYHARLGSLGGGAVSR